MPKEIERKFLIANDDWRKAVTHRVQIRDGLVAACEGRKIRVRFYDQRATITVKGRRNGLSRDEFEYDIPPADAEAMLRDHCGGDVLEKTRHHIHHAGLDWVIDEYFGILAGVLIAEVELPFEDMPIQRPDWLGREVTGDDRYRKINMLIDRRNALAAESA